MPCSVHAVFHLILISALRILSLFYKKGTRGKVPPIISLLYHILILNILPNTLQYYFIYLLIVSSQYNVRKAHVGRLSFVHL